MAVLGLQQGVKAVQLLSPKPAIEAQPLIGRGQRRGLDVAKVTASLYPASHQSGALKNFDVLRGRGKRHAERCRQFADGVLAGCKSAQHGAPGWVGQGAKHGIEVDVGLLNHLV